MICSICLDPIGAGDPIEGHGQHRFHEDCLEEWRGGRIVYPCPLCRAELNSENRRLERELALRKVIAVFFFATGLLAFCADKGLGERGCVLLGVSAMLVLNKPVEQVADLCINLLSRLGPF